MRKAHKLGLLAGVSMMALSGAALAGGIAVPEQSASFLGTAFAGAAAGGDLSSMYWNPAALVTVPGTQTEDHITAGRQNSNVQAGPGSTLLGSAGIASNSGNIFPDAVIPASYFGHQINDNMFFGLGINAPFGSRTRPDNRNWAGFTQATEQKFTTYNVNPDLAYKIAPGLSVGVGLQMEYIQARLKSAASLTALGIPLTSSPNTVLKGEDVAFGFTAGVHWKPSETTQIGLGYRSGIKHNLDGTFGFTNQIALTTGQIGISAPINLPDIATLSLRHEVSSNLAVLATAQWTAWSKFDQLVVTCTTNSNIPVKACGPGQTLQSIPFNWHDGWFLSVGGEYKLNPKMLLRTGVAWEKSPIENPSEQSVAIVDSDRIWVSAGLEYQLTPTITTDLSYAHVFFQDGTIDRTSGTVRLVGTTERSADVLAVALKMKFGAAAEPLK